MIHELREYTAAPGPRPDLVTRFRDHTAEHLTERGPAFAPPAVLDARWVVSDARPVRRATKRVRDPLVAANRSRLPEPLA